MRLIRCALIGVLASSGLVACKKGAGTAKPTDIVAMLNAGDPKACIDKNVQDAALTISVPEYRKFVGEFPRILFTDVSAAKVDKDLKEIVCEANLDLSSALPNSAKVPIQYAIRPSLDQEGQWVVATLTRQYASTVQAYMGSAIQMQRTAQTPQEEKIPTAVDVEANSLPPEPFEQDETSAAAEAALDDFTPPAPSGEDEILINQ